MIGTLMAAAAATASGCIVPERPAGTPTPPPVIVEAPPATVQPGETFTFVIDVITLEGDVDTSWVMRPPGLQVSRGECATTGVEHPSGHVRRETVACTIPTFATNGRWNLEVATSWGVDHPWQAPPSVVNLPIDVVGGPEENGGPEVLAWAIGPDVLHQDTRFVLVVTLRDPSGLDDFTDSIIVFRNPLLPDSTIRCGNRTIEQTGPDLWTFTWRCSPHYFGVEQPAEAGTYSTSPAVRFHDLLGNSSETVFTVTLQPGLDG